MKTKRHPWINTLLVHHPGATLYIQAPLPNCLDTLPKLLTVEGQGSVLAGCAPSAPPEEPANDN